MQLLLLPARGRRQRPVRRRRTGLHPPRKMCVAVCSIELPLPVFAYQISKIVTHAAKPRLGHALLNIPVNRIRHRDRYRFPCHNCQPPDKCLKWPIVIGCNTDSYNVLQKNHRKWAVNIEPIGFMLTTDACPRVRLSGRFPTLASHKKLPMTRQEVK